MIFKLVLQGLRRGKARFACAVAGMSVAVGALVFMTSLVATNNAQAPRLAETACAPWAAWRAEGLQLGGIRFTERRQLAAPHRLHHPDRNSPGGEQVVLFLGLLQCPVHVVQLNLAELDVNMFSAVNNSLINDGCGLYRGRQILPYEHLSRFQNDLID